MKKAVAFVLSGMLCAGLLSGCGNGGNMSSTAATDSGASVYYLNFKPEQDRAWQELAQIYTEQTGVPVTVVTAAGGDYETTLMAEMGKSAAPTLFQVNGPVGLKNWQDYCYDLKNTDIVKELTSDAYTLKGADDSISGVAYTIESYGLITNKGLLDKAGYTIEEIDSFDALKRIAEDITEREEELGFAAFASAGMDSTSDWRFKTHLANLPVYFEYQDMDVELAEALRGQYLDQFRGIWDLYINNSTVSPVELSAKTADDARNEFLAEKAVFFQNGSWEYSNLVGEGKFSDEELQMIPIYIGAGDEGKQGLCTGTENYWCVNKEAAEEDIQATLDFMNWCVTSEVGTKAMSGGGGAMPSGEAGMGFVIPFKDAPRSENLFVKQDQELTAQGKEPIPWAFATMPSDEWKNSLGSALTAYAAEQTDANWDVVKDVFVNGWKQEYQLANR